MEINAFIFVGDEVNGSDGVINITVSGGNPPYTYDWSGPMGYTSTNEDIGGLIEVLYFKYLNIIGCTVTDTALVNSFVGLDERLKIDG